MPRSAHYSRSDVMPERRNASTAALGARVDSLADSVGRLSSKMDRTASSDEVNALAAKIDRLSQPSTPQYATWIAAAALLVSLSGTFFFLGISPMKENVERLEKEAKSTTRENASELKEIRASVVPRGEHEQRWLAGGAQISNIQRQIDDINKRTAEVYTARDIIMDLRQDVKTLKDRVFMSDGHPKP